MADELDAGASASVGLEAGDVALRLLKSLLPGELRPEETFDWDEERDDFIRRWNTRIVLRRTGSDRLFGHQLHLAEPLVAIMPLVAWRGDAEIVVQSQQAVDQLATGHGIAVAVLRPIHHAGDQGYKMNKPC